MWLITLDDVYCIWKDGNIKYHGVSFGYSFSEFCDVIIGAGWRII